MIVSHLSSSRLENGRRRLFYYNNIFFFFFFFFLSSSFVIVSTTAAAAAAANAGSSSSFKRDYGDDGILLKKYDLMLLTTTTTTSKSNNDYPPQLLLTNLQQTSSPPPPPPTIIISLPPPSQAAGCSNPQYDQIITNNNDQNSLFFICDGNTIGEITLSTTTMDNEGGEITTTTASVLYNASSSSSSNSNTPSSHPTKLIKDLNYSNSTIFWIESDKTIKSLRTKDNKINVLVTEEFKISTMSITNNHPVIYYSLVNSRTNSSIISLHISSTSSSTHTVLATGLMLPTSMDVVDNALYLITNPPGIYFLIERIDLLSGDRSTLVKEHDNHGVRLVVTGCHEVYWLDLSNRVWRVNEGKLVEFIVQDDFKKFDGISGIKRECLRRSSHGNSNELLVVNPILVVRKGSSSSSEQKGSSRESQKDKYYTTIMPVTTRTTTTSNSKTNGLRLCDSDEKSQINCFGNEFNCVVIGERSGPICLTPNKAATNELQNKTINSSSNVSSLSTLPPLILVIISVLSTTTTILVMVVLYMCVRVRNLSRKPRIRRRLVVSRTTSESHNNQQPASVCEMIDIENCCNMNVCETPCYERALNPQQQSSTSNNNNHHHHQSSVNSTNGAWTNNCSKDSSSNNGDRKCLLSI